MKILTILAVAVSGVWAGQAELDRATKSYRRTQYEEVLRLLSPLPQKSAAELLLIGKAQFMTQQFKRATEALEQAAAAEPRNAEVWLWLGRSYGRRAETATVFTAPGLASKCRSALERSVELDGANREALNDLFEYYLQAPGFMGGGEAKARGLIARIAALDPAERYYAEARLASNKKEFQTAEAQLRRAIDLAPQQIGRVLDLAKFLNDRGRIQESEEAFRRAEKLDPRSPKLIFARAEAYIQAKRNLPEARQLLQRYLNSELSPDDPPRHEAEKLLKLASGG